MLGFTGDATRMNAFSEYLLQENINSFHVSMVGFIKELGEFGQCKKMKFLFKCYVNANGGYLVNSVPSVVVCSKTDQLLACL